MKLCLVYLIIFCFCPDGEEHFYVLPMDKATNTDDLQVHRELLTSAQPLKIEIFKCLRRHPRQHTLTSLVTFQPNIRGDKERAETEVIFNDVYLLMYLYTVIV